MQPNGPALIVEPDDGSEPVRAFISSAQSSLHVKQFTFTDETLVQPWSTGGLSASTSAAG